MSILSKEDREFLEGFLQHVSIGCRGWDWWAWPQSFSSTAGPRGGGGGQAMTQFQIFGFENHQTGERFKCCAGVWKPWDGQVGGKWE